MTSVEEVASRIAESRRYGGVDDAVVRRLAKEELSHAASADDAVKRVKRRLHQAIGAFQSHRSVGSAFGRDLARLSAAHGDDASPEAFRAVCRDLLAGHASTRERLPYLDRFYPGIWTAMGKKPDSLVDVGSGLAPLALPWMQIPASARYQVVDADRAALALVDAFLSMMEQVHAVEALDLAGEVDLPPADVALLLKLIPILDRQEPGAALRLVAGLAVRHAVVSFPVRSLGGRGRGMERTYRGRFDELVRELGPRVTGVVEASVPNELVFVLTLASRGAAAGG